MPIDPALPVIGVFGGNEPRTGELPSARMLGRAIHLAGAVLLTGGDGYPQTVKDAAIAEVNAAAAEAGVAAWMGVANKRHAGPPVWHGRQSVVVRPGWHHRRNFVEACLCDAAFAVGAHSFGAASEALFCLYLGRPLVVIGDVTIDDVTPQRLHELALKRIKAPEGILELAVDRGISDAYDWAAAPDARAAVRPFPRDDAEAADLVTELVDASRQSPRLDIDATNNERRWDAYVDECLTVVHQPGP
jgi:hypothetical protein